MAVNQINEVPNLPGYRPSIPVRFRELLVWAVRMLAAPAIARLLDPLNAQTHTRTNETNKKSRACRARASPARRR